MKINIVGRGNVATHLSLALENKAEVIRVNPRSLEEYSLDADITLIAVSRQCHKGSGGISTGFPCNHSSHIRINSYRHT